MVCFDCVKYDPATETEPEPMKVNMTFGISHYFAEVHLRWWDSKGKYYYYGILHNVILGTKNSIDIIEWITHKFVDKVKELVVNA